MVLHEPLDLQYWLVNTLSGSWEIFWFISLIFIALMGAKFKMKNSTFGVMLSLYAILMAAFGASWLLILICIMGGLMIYLIIAKIM